MSAYEITDEMDLLARMVAMSPAFQAEVKKYTTDGAETRVHQVVAERPEDLPRPFAEIDFGELAWERNAGGDRNYFIESADAMTLRFAANMDNEADPGGSLKRFRAWVRQVIREVLEHSGHDDCLNITGVTTVQVPVYANELSGSQVRWMFAEFSIEYGTI